ncbi:histone acetyltransferase type B catalytic subunit-like isoform X2 [Asterias rubens]|uniref:histone acetyltransferase type B catalytic subunit-like isoform X2 n=1 Tax=Asterias rubens TaxID=7604 RepID=UPI0014550AEA|nr:histone acetyltransferase type B catalytic subunit-like isoform X2 [Asterias rubens]
MADVTLMKNVLEEFVCSSNDVIELKLVREEADVFNDDKIFQPEFTHQLFGQSENIFGYKGLKVQLYFTAARLVPYLHMTSSSKVNSKLFDGVKADNVLKTIIDQLEIQPLDNLDKFLTVISDDSTFQPMGDLLHAYSVEGEGPARHFEVYSNSITTPGFKEYHERLQTFLWWYIDAASYIDTDDEKWDYYTIFERYSVDGNKRYAVAGYATAYRYYAYPDLIRPRISQVLILPPFQRQGHGVHLLEAMYTHFRNDNKVLDVTVEDPSDNFVRLRDFVDCRNCQKLPAFTPPNLGKGFSPEMEKQALEKLKLCKKQVRRVYEILRLRVTDSSNPEEMKEYRLDVKKRLNIPFQKQKSDYEKMRRTLKPEELSATMQGTNLQERQETLENWYQELITSYDGVIERLAMD